ncbi:hypothetical protein SAMN05216210_2008 [Halopseudomonas salegens]|uniref:Uncharacterized protein n=1 Tax=Halopseudomonas salegens TaxID=1434072 RepID=A0A1H2G3C1_9GAMM|nr:hypothetical protein SAMN05216210_2008 [Halopseudomonas salegens]
MELLTYLGVGIAIIGALGFLIAAFQQSIWWGLGCFFLSPISFVFLVIHWSEAKNPFFLQLIGLAIIMLAST